MKKICFVPLSGVQQLNCYYKAFVDEFEIDLDNLEDARPPGYKVKLQFSIVGGARAKITLKGRSHESKYVIGIIDMNKNNLKIVAITDSIINSSNWSTHGG